MDYRKELIEVIVIHARPQGDETDALILKGYQHKKAHDLCKAYLEKGDYLSAYTIAFSLLEDRLRSMAIVLQRDVLKGDNYKIYITQGIARVISFVYDKTPENLILIQNLKNIAFNRNKLLHEAMWRTDAITPTDVEHVMKLKSIVANDLAKIKRRIKSNQ